MKRSIFEITSARWEPVGLFTGAMVEVENRPVDEGDLVLAQVNGFFVIGIWLPSLQLDSDVAHSYLLQPGRFICLTAQGKFKILGAVVLPEAVAILQNQALAA